MKTNELKQLNGLKLLVVESNVVRRTSLVKQLLAGNARVAVAKSVVEAKEIVDDARFIEFEFDGLITSERLTDGLGWDVIAQFRKEYPDRETLLLSDAPDLTTTIWARANNISLSTHDNNSAAFAAISTKQSAKRSAHAWVAA